MRTRILILLSLLCTIIQGTSGQGFAIDPKQPVSAADVEVTEVGYLQFMGHDSLVVDPATGQIDTLYINDGRRLIVSIR